MIYLTRMGKKTNIAYLIQMSSVWLDFEKKNKSGL
jgi:hypothetical protein